MKDAMTEANKQARFDALFARLVKQGVHPKIALQRAAYAVDGADVIRD